MESQPSLAPTHNRHYVRFIMCGSDRFRLLEVGRAFCAEVKRVMTEELALPLREEVAIGIGSPPKAHRFDLADTNARVAHATSRTVAAPLHARLIIRQYLQAYGCPLSNNLPP